jgi:hypothetical protein
MSAFAFSRILKKDVHCFQRSRKGLRPRPAARLAVEPLEARHLLTGTWTWLDNLAPSRTGTMMLLSDGSVMVQEGGDASNQFFKLTPDATGSYVHGTWSMLAPMHIARKYYGSNLLPDGRLFLVGGEHSSAGRLIPTGEIYDPNANSWTDIMDFPESQFGDDPTEMLPDGTVLAGHIGSPRTYIYNPATGTWTRTGDKLRDDRSAEETWLKLPDDSVLSYDIFAPGNAQRYVSSTSTWVTTGPVPVDLSSPSLGNELGPAFLLPDGRAWWTGASGKTAYYTPTSDTWTAGPDLPIHKSGRQLSAYDNPGAMMPNGHVLIAVGTVPPLADGVTTVLEFDTTTDTYTDVMPADYHLGPATTNDRMVMVPSGQVLFTNGSNQLIVYTPEEAPDPAWKPVIDGIADNGDGSFTLTGEQLNGISQGASLGDDAEMDSNYPIVALTDVDGNVFYARTYLWSSTGVATGTTPVTTQFALTAGIPAGDYNLTVSANGIISDPVAFTVGGGGGASLPPHSHGADKILTTQAHWPIGQHSLTASPPTPDSPRPQLPAAGVSLDSGGMYPRERSQDVMTPQVRQAASKVRASLVNLFFGSSLPRQKDTVSTATVFFVFGSSTTD